MTDRERVAILRATLGEIGRAAYHAELGAPLDAAKVRRLATDALRQTRIVDPTPTLAAWSAYRRTS